MARSLSRRAFLASAGAVAVGGGARAAGCAEDAPAAAAADARALSFILFTGRHQAGITSQPSPSIGRMAAFIVPARDRVELTAMFRDLSDEIEGLMSGRPPVVREPAFPHGAGQLDQGLAFVSYQRSLETGFLAVQ